MKPIFSMVLAGCALGLMVAGCGGGSSSSSSTASAAPASSAAAATADGAKVYDTNCSSCHGANGQGSAGAPPLAGNPVVTGDAAKAIHIVKYGLTGSIKVAGSTYNGTMPAFGENLSNADIATAITFVRSSWGNKAATVTEAEVAASTK